MSKANIPLKIWDENVRISSFPMHAACLICFILADFITRGLSLCRFRAITPACPTIIGRSHVTRGLVRSVMVRPHSAFLGIYIKTEPLDLFSRARGSERNRECATLGLSFFPRHQVATSPNNNNCLINLSQEFSHIMNAACNPFISSRFG
jgi:hypothetical protein